MTEPTRPIRQPSLARDGSLVAHTVATPTAFTTRAMLMVGSRNVIPVVFVPGIMGSNLRARTAPAPASETGIKPGDPVWRAPNGTWEGVTALGAWTNRSPKHRQQILHAASCDVDPGGEILMPASIAGVDQSGGAAMLTDEVLRARGWGEIHCASYGKLLAELETYLNTTFRLDGPGKRRITAQWKRVIDCDRSKWGMRSLDPLTEAELAHYAKFQFPVYAVGYNWLASCTHAATRLQRRIGEIIAYWSARKHACSQVILVTHSMGGLVARACARRIPGQIAGIVHGAMPALGAPVAYRRIACGVEPSSPGSVDGNDVAAAAFSLMVGRTSRHTTPVMATSAGVLELLPNHLYPGPWMHLRTVSAANGKKSWRDWISLPTANPYVMYRQFDAWYRMVDLALADPANLYGKQGGVRDAVIKAIDAAERFHMKELGSYYHPNTYAYYGDDPARRTYSRISWIADDKAAQGRVALNAASIARAKPKTYLVDGGRCVDVDGCLLSFVPEPQDAPGDGTVPASSGACTGGRLRQLFPVRGFSHQQSYGPDYIVMLTQHLVAKIVQEVK